ncbi:MAG TPA: LD-carboxypeptidase [Bacteroidales bacterium]|nr:LD-carboxypeptidase [Bacteroidales bacterium]HPS61982.1 LD-carboxypeptidase [Bacteroidales bacterium]
MITPAYLKKGDQVAIVSPARSITFEEVHPAIRFFGRNGLEAVLGNYVFSRHRQFAGTDEQRSRDFQSMLDHPDIRAIVCSRGGYGTVRILDRLDFTAFCENPKWIVGYSDVTVLHSHIHRRFGIETLHAPMPVNIKGDQPDDSLQTMINALFGKRIAYTVPRAPLSREGRAEGILTGGNLSVLYSLMGTPSEIDTDGKILFIEDLDEYLYHIDRMMMNLKRAGKLAKLKGLIVGGMTKMNDNTIPYGMTAQEIVADAVAGYPYPVCFDFPAGHLDTNLALILGRKVKLTVGPQVQLSFY